MFSATLPFTRIFEEHPKLKLQKEFTEYVTDECFKVFQKYVLECAHASTAEKIAIRTSDPPGVSILSSLFTAKLTQDTCLTKIEFTMAARQYPLKK